MRSLISLLSFASVMALAFWAYQENYRTQDALKSVAKLQREIAQLREVEAVLEAEWAFLNRPERLMALVELNFDTLGLLPMTPDAFGDVEQISYPTSLISSLANPIDVIGQLAETRP